MASKEVSYKKVRRKSNKLLIVGLILILVIGVVLVGVFEFSKEHFGRTTIQDVDCSWLSVEKAKERIEDNIGETEVTFTIGGKTYVATYEELGAEVSSEKLETLLENQNFFGQNDFTLENGVSVSKEKVKDFLSSISELKEESVVKPQNAYIKFDGNSFVIEKEVIGNQINYDKAYNIIAEAITGVDENINIDLTPAMELPQILSTDTELISNCNELNNILSTVITIKLMDGSEYTLDKDVMRNWITYDETDFSFELEKGVTKFVEEISKDAKDVTTVQFK